MTIRYEENRIYTAECNICGCLFTVEKNSQTDMELFMKKNGWEIWKSDNVHQPNCVCFWCNFDIKKRDFVRPKLRAAQIPQLQEALGYELTGYKLPNKRQVLRNCVLPAVGEHILSEALKGADS